MIKLMGAHTHRARQRLSRFRSARTVPGALIESMDARSPAGRARLLHGTALEWLGCTRERFAVKHAHARESRDALSRADATRAFDICHPARLRRAAAVAFRRRPGARERDAQRRLRRRHAPRRQLQREQYTLNAHCNGTHTECVGHVTDERSSVHARLLGGPLYLAALVTVAPVDASAAARRQTPTPTAGDRVITRACPGERAGTDGRHRSHRSARRTHTAERAGQAHAAYDGASPAPFFTLRGGAISSSSASSTCCVDLPSIDRCT